LTGTDTVADEALTMRVNFLNVQAALMVIIVIVHINEIRAVKMITTVTDIAVADTGKMMIN
jgi:hypothetical protein